MGPGTNEKYNGGNVEKNNVKNLMYGLWNISLIPALRFPDFELSRKPWTSLNIEQEWNKENAIT